MGKRPAWTRSKLLGVAFGFIACIHTHAQQAWRPRAIGGAAKHVREHYRGRMHEVKCSHIQVASDCPQTPRSGGCRGILLVVMWIDCGTARRSGEVGADPDGTNMHASVSTKASEVAAGNGRQTVFVQLAHTHIVADRWHDAAFHAGVGAFCEQAQPTDHLLPVEPGAPASGSSRSLPLRVAAHSQGRLGGLSIFDIGVWGEKHVVGKRKCVLSPARWMTVQCSMYVGSTCVFVWNLPYVQVPCTYIYLS